MKNHFTKLLISTLCFTTILGCAMVCHAEEIDEREILINNYEDYVNNQELDNYIDLFDSETQNWMNQSKDDPNFFLGEQIDIKHVKMLSADTGEEAAYIEDGEFGNKDVSVYYVQAVCDTSNVISENIKPLNGNISYVFVFVKENETWKIGRVSIADISRVVEKGEGFNNEVENNSLMRENNAMTRASLSEPSTICIKMTKTANQNAWGKTYADVTFSDYIKNVVPNEFTVSYGGAYLRAGTMVTKMYGWYYTIHKKYPNSPGGCDLQDTSVDQNYLAGSYNNLGTYKKTMDSAFTDISNKALVNNSGTIFLTQYISSTTDSKTGKLGAATALSLSNQGKTYMQILQNAYNNSTNAGGTTVKEVTY